MGKGLARDQARAKRAAKRGGEKWGFIGRDAIVYPMIQASQRFV